MLRFRRFFKEISGMLRPFVVLSVLAALGSTCCGGSTPATPTVPSTTTTTTPAPTTATTVSLDSPAADDQLATLRPTLAVKTLTPAVAGRTYEFQIADRSDFSAGGGAKSAYYAVNLTKSGVAEGGATTSVLIDQDLQPATRFYWRARWTQGGTTSDWSTTGTFRTQVVGWNRPGELYDPLVNGVTMAEFRFKRTTFMAGKGLRMDDSDSYARYRLQQTISNGEFSADIEGLSANPVSENPDTGKLKIFSMLDGTYGLYGSDYLMDVQYRGLNGNPDNAISFKILFGEDDEDHKLEPDLGTRIASVRKLNAASTYHWKATWANFFHLTVLDGGVGGVGGGGSGVGGTQIYDYGKDTIYTYAPNPQYAYLGVNDSASESGSWPGAIYRNVWIANKGRPASLGSAMAPKN
jgi:hypothetical protein